MNIIKCIIIFSLLILSTCSEDRPKTEKDVIVKEHLNLDSASRAVTDGFYSWYIGEYINQNYSICQRHATFKKFANEKYGLDIENYIKCLDTFQYFSTSFKGVLINKNRQCSDAMQNDSQNINPFEEKFILEKNNELCSFLWHDIWIGGQGENITGFEITSASSMDSSHAEITVAILIESKIFVQALVSTVVENNEAKIENIELKFE